MAALGDVKEWVRGRLGDVEETKLPDEQVELSLDAALREFARYHPLTQQVEITLSTGTTDYDLPAGALKVLSFDVKDVTLNTNDPFALQMGGFYKTEGLDEWLDEMVESAQVFQTATGPKVRLLPSLLMGVPVYTQAHRVYCEVTFARAIDQLTDEELEHIILFAMGECLQYLGTRRSKPVVVIPTANGALRLDTGKAFTDKGKELCDDFHRRLGREASVMVAG